MLKYGIYKNKYTESILICHVFFISVCKTGHLTALWTENKVKYMIEINLCTWHGKFQILHDVHGSLLKSTLCINMVCIRTNILKLYKYVIYFFMRVCKTGHLIQYELKMCQSIRLN